MVMTAPASYPMSTRLSIQKAWPTEMVPMTTSVVNATWSPTNESCSQELDVAGLLFNSTAWAGRRRGPIAGITPMTTVVISAPRAASPAEVMSTETSPSRASAGGPYVRSSSTTQRAMTSPAAAPVDASSTLSTSSWRSTCQCVPPIADSHGELPRSLDVARQQEAGDRLPRRSPTPAPRRRRETAASAAASGR